MAQHKIAETKENSSTIKFYLMFYNCLQILGWTYVLLRVINFYQGNPVLINLWSNVQFAVVLLINLSALEVFHAVTGIVRSSPVVTALQIGGRAFVIDGVVLATPFAFAASSVGIPLALTAWSITEIIRYGYYIANTLGHIPHILIWLRYTTFIVLYPIGVTGELLCIYAATKYTQAYPEAISLSMPNSWNFTFSYHYFLITVMLLYIPLFPKLYIHMFSLRRKSLGTVESKFKKGN